MNKIKLVIIGDFAWETDITPYGTKKSLAGSGFYGAIGASTVAVANSVGIVGKVGDDFPIKLLSKRNIDIRGVAVVAHGKTANFTMKQDLIKNTRVFTADFGVAEKVDTTIFPSQYTSASHIHFATTHPTKVLTWLPFIKKQLPQTYISADTFETFAEESPDLTYRVFNSVDLVFLNETELHILQSKIRSFSLIKPYVLKKGSKGAIYIDQMKNIRVNVSAPKVKAIETTGAGEILAVVFLVLQMQGKTIQKSLQQAVNIASLSVTEFGVEHLSPLEAY